MQEALRSVLSPWESFYVIVGSSGAALTGLQFVVIALVADTRPRGSGSTIAAFGTPTVVHFCAALFVAATLSAPWRSLGAVALTLGVCGAWGVIYTAIVMQRARHQTGYRPVFEDWLFHVMLPFASYAAILGSAVELVGHPEGALFPIGAVTLLLLFIGIHNAWDTVTYVALTVLPENESSEGVPGPELPPSPNRPKQPVS